MEKVEKDFLNMEKCITFVIHKNKVMLTIRLSKDTEKQLAQYCQDEGLTKSSVVKEAVALYLSQKRKTKSAYEAGKDLFGLEGSGSSDLSVSYKQKLKNKLNAKHAH